MKRFIELLKTSYYELINPPVSEFTVDMYPDLTGTVALVTGLSAGIGTHVAMTLLSKNCHVIMGVRNQEKSEKVREWILKQLGDNGGNEVGKIDIMLMDLSDLETLRQVPVQLQRITPHLDIIIHNAGLGSSPSRTKTAQGFDRIIGTNILGTFLLQKYLDPFFLKDSESPYKRLVWLSSFAQQLSPPNGGLNYDQLDSKVPFYGTLDGYTLTKVALIYFSYYWYVVHKDVINEKFISLNVHPGFVSTDIARDDRMILRWVLKTCSYDCKYGADTVIYAAIAPNLNSQEHQGAYICPWGRVGELRSDIKLGFTNGELEKIWKWLESHTWAFIDHYLLNIIFVH